MYICGVEVCSIIIVFYLFTVPQPGIAERPSHQWCQRFQTFGAVHGSSMQEKYNLFQVVAAVLHLGNITFEENTLDRKG